MRKGTKHVANYRGSPEERFWSKVNKTDTCWLWVGAKDNNGYGAIRVNSKNINAHRFSYQILKGRIGNGLFVCHSCDNPSCVNPEHLFLGTNYDNVQDMVKKMRNTLGEKNGMSFLSAEDVTKIRTIKDKYSRRELASMFSIGESTLSQIINYKRWKHIV